MEYTQRSRSEFMGSQIVQDAVVRNLQVLAESTTRLSDGIRSTEPALPWEKIRGFRNVLTHAYLSVDLELVWEVIAQDLPELEAAVERMRAANMTRLPGEDQSG